MKWMYSIGIFSFFSVIFELNTHSIVIGNVTAFTQSIVFFTRGFL